MRLAIGKLYPETVQLEEMAGSWTLRLQWLWSEEAWNIMNIILGEKV